MKIFDVTKTSYEDNSYWVHYEINGKIGYEIIYPKIVNQKYYDTDCQGYYNKIEYYLDWELKKNYIEKSITLENTLEINQIDIIQKMINSEIEFKYELCSKPNLDDVENKYIVNLITNCLQSENEMWFVEYDDEEFNELNQDESFLPNLELEVQKLGLDDYIKFGEDDCYITIYGGVITQFLF